MVAGVEAGLQEQLIVTEWKDMFSRHGLRVSWEKTEVMWVVQRRRVGNTPGCEEALAKRQLCIPRWSNM
jgi:hypothetical protein